MHREEMERLIKEHLRAEQAGDPAGSVAMYTDDVVHDVVGSPLGPGRERDRGPVERSGACCGSNRVTAGP